MPQKTVIYTHSLKKIIIEAIEESEHSILIAMAWFTDKNIKDCLLQHKKNFLRVRIEIVVDDNNVNDAYFNDYKDFFRDAGIVIRRKTNRKFLHHKFMVIDNIKCITGSYNYTNKAVINLENIQVTKAKRAAAKLIKEFRLITEENYRDENIDLLFKYPDFSQSLLSTYYKFTKAEYKKYRNKIVIGECWTYPTHDSDAIHYSPGLIFNDSISFSPEFGEQEFTPPVKKRVLRDWKQSQSLNNILSSYGPYPDLYSQINGAIKASEKSIRESFLQKLENTFSYCELEKLINGNIDILTETGFWSNNFAPYLTKPIVAELFASFPEIGNQANITFSSSVSPE